jgi:hypothetical protein
MQHNYALLGRQNSFKIVQVIDLVTVVGYNLLRNLVIFCESQVSHFIRVIMLTVITLSLSQVNC